MSFFEIFSLIIRRECLLSFRKSSECFKPLLFFVVVATLFPLATSPDPELLTLMGPAVIWVAALLAVLLSLNRLFQEDHMDGTLEQLILSPFPLSLLIFAKVIAYWFMMGLPVIIIAPVIAMMFHLSAYAIVVLIASLLIGTPILYLIGAIGSAVTVGLRNSGLLLTLLLLPLYVPTLIFGSAAVSAAVLHQSVAPHLALLGAILALSITLAPVATAFSLRVGIEYDR